MCTVTFLPLGGQRFILASNRDESRLRPSALPPQPYREGPVLAVYPKDTEAQGTWIASADNGYTLVLLNGAFEAHLRQPPYRRSRGLMVLDFFRFNDVQHFARTYDFTGIEPFTLLVLKEGELLEMNELRWDAGQLPLTEVDTSRPHVWSSVTLYPAPVRRQREQWFARWLEGRPEPELDDILQFHRFGGTGDTTNDVRMRRSEVFTVSITAVTNLNGPVEMLYEDLINHATTSLKAVYEEQ